MAAHLPLFNLILMMKVVYKFGCHHIYLFVKVQVFTGFHKCLQEQINCIPNVHGHNHSATQQNLLHC